jgi:hypothetical protein
MKKNNQVYVLLIISFLAVVIFLYYTHRLKITEGQTTLSEVGTKLGKTRQTTGETIPMSSKNINTITSVLEDLENDFDSDIPEIRADIPRRQAEEVRLSQRINALDGRISEFEKNMPDDEEEDDEEEDDEEEDDEEDEKEYTITPAVSIKYGGHK